MGDLPGRRSLTFQCFAWTFLMVCLHRKSRNACIQQILSSCIIMASNLCRKSSKFLLYSRGHRILQDLEECRQGSQCSKGRCSIGVDQITSSTMYGSVKSLLQWGLQMSTWHQNLELL